MCFRETIPMETSARVWLKIAITKRRHSHIWLFSVRFSRDLRCILHGTKINLKSIFRIVSPIGNTITPLTPDKFEIWKFFHHFFQTAIGFGFRLILLFIFYFLCAVFSSFNWVFLCFLLIFSSFFISFIFTTNLKIFISKINRFQRDT